MDDQDRYTRITLRIPKDLHSKLQESADKTSKSMNAEIIARLHQSFASDGAFQVSGIRIDERALDEARLERVINEASERSAKRALEEASKAVLVKGDPEGILRELERVRNIIERTYGAIAPDGPHDSDKPSRTSSIPGVNTTKGGSKAPKK